VRGIAVVGEADSGERALMLVRELKPNVVLMDLRMPGIGGLEATRRLQRLDAGARVLIVTACDADPYPTQAMKAGAAGYITKGANAEDLEFAIRRVFLGQRHVSDAVAQQLALRSFETAPECPFDQLSNREMQITLMVVSCRKVQQISRDLHLSPKTVNSYRYRIFEKLSVSSDVGLTLLAVRHGVIEHASAAATPQPCERIETVELMSA
jgi:two-component system invasion response regulator UvrY